MLSGVKPKKEVAEVSNPGFPSFHVQIFRMEEELNQGSRAGVEAAVVDSSCAMVDSSRDGVGASRAVGGYKS